MKIIKEGDKGKGVCQDCGLMSITYMLKDVPFSDGSGEVKNIIAGVCDKCGKVVSVPRQSVPKIRTEYQKCKSLEARVPAHFLDILNLATERIDNDLGPDFIKHLILYYVNFVKENSAELSSFANLLKDDIAHAKSSKRISLKITPKIEKDMNEVVRLTGLKNNTDLVKGIILKINEDIVQPKTPIHMKELRAFASAFW